MENQVATKRRRLHNLRGNKGYYGLVLGDTAQASIMLSLNLMLISVPLGVLMGVVNFGVNIFAGIKTQPAPVQKKDPVLLTAAMAGEAPQEKRPLKAAWAFTKKMKRYISATFRDPRVVVGSSAAAAGTNILFQSLWGIHSILTTHSLLFVGSVSGLAMTGAVAGCAVIGALATFCIVAGTFDKWKGFSRFFTRHFRDGKNAEAQPTKKPSRFLAKHPRLQRFVKSPLARRAKDILMILLTLESSIFVVGASSTLIAGRLSTIIRKPGKILADIVPLAIALNWGKGPIINFIAVGRLTLGRHIKQLIGKFKKKSGNSAVPEQALEAVLPESPSHTGLVPPAAEPRRNSSGIIVLPPAFNNKAAKHGGESKAIPEGAAEAGDKPPSAPAEKKPPVISP